MAATMHPYAPPHQHQPQPQSFAQPPPQMRPAHGQPPPSHPSRAPSGPYGMPPPPASYAPLSSSQPRPSPVMRADILALAAADAALGVRFVPPLSASLGAGGRFPMFQPLFIPPTNLPPQHQQHQQYQQQQVSEVARTKKRGSVSRPAAAGLSAASLYNQEASRLGEYGSSGAAARAPSSAPVDSVAATVPRGGNNAATRAAAAKKAIAEAAAKGQVRKANSTAAAAAALRAEQMKGVARLSQPLRGSSRRGSASASTRPTAPSTPSLRPSESAAPHDPPVLLPAAVIAPSAAASSASVSLAPSTPRGGLQAHIPSLPSSPRSASRPVSRGGSRPTTPRSGSRTPRRLQGGASSSGPSSPRAHSRGGDRHAPDDTTSNGSKGKKLLDEADVRRLLTELLSEAGLAGEVALDGLARQDRLVSLVDARAARADLVAREEEERARRMEEQTRRPHYYLHQARGEVREFQQQLLPLLQQADAALERLYDRSSQAVPGGAGIRSASLSHTLSAASAHAIARHADQLGDAIFDTLLDDTVSWLNHVDAARQLDGEAQRSAGDLAEAWERVEQFEAQREAMRAKYTKQGETDVRLHLPHVQVQEAHPLHAAAPAMVTSSPPVPNVTVLPTPSAPTSTTAAASTTTRPPLPSDETFAQAMRAPLFTHSITAAPKQQQSSSPPPPPVPVARGRFPPPSTFAPSYQDAPASSLLSAPPTTSSAGNFASLPSIPGLVMSVQAGRAEFEAHVAHKNQQQFLLPGQLQLHTIVAAAGDDVLDSLIDSVVAEVGAVCDGYVERVFDAEFQVDLEQMAEQDWNEQQQEQQQHSEEQQQHTRQAQAQDQRQRYGDEAEHEESHLQA